MKKDYTHIAIVLDESGSMHDQATDVIGGYNKFLSEQKKVQGTCTVTLVKFSSKVEDPIYDFINLQFVKDLSSDAYFPGGCTALLDAVGQTIVSVGKKLSDMSEDNRPEKVIVVIITDGEENSSRNFSFEAIKTLIEQQQKIYNWQFVFIGAGLDAFRSGTQMGVISSSTLSSSRSSAGYARAYESLSENITSYRVGVKSCVDFEQSDIDAQVACGVDPSIANKSAKSS